MNKTKIFYHANCPDGSAAAWTAWRYFKNNAVYIPKSYYDNFVETVDEGDTVYLLDFYVNRQLLLDWYDRAESIIVLDHHATAERDVGDLDFVTVDTNECGATLAFKHFFPGQQWSRIYDYVRDRDLWLWEQFDSRAINAYISHRLTMEEESSQLDQFMTWYELDEMIIKDYATIVDMGQIIQEYRAGLIKRLLKSAGPLEVGGYIVPAVNSSLMMSDVGNALLKKYPDAPFSCVYVIQNGKLRCSLRSEEGREDVSKICETYGGGGHRNAGGMSFIPHDWSQVGNKYEK